MNLLAGQNHHVRQVGKVDVLDHSAADSNFDALMLAADQKVESVRYELLIGGVAIVQQFSQALDHLGV